MEKETAYSLLNVPINATSDEILQAYRKISLKYHPRRYDSTERFIQIHFKKLAEAYSTLIDPEKRYEYDQSLVKNGKLRPSNLRNRSTPIIFNNPIIDPIHDDVQAPIRSNTLPTISNNTQRNRRNSISNSDRIHDREARTLKEEMESFSFLENDRNLSKPAIRNHLGGGSSHSRIGIPYHQSLGINLKTEDVRTREAMGRNGSSHDHLMMESIQRSRRNSTSNLKIESSNPYHPSHLNNLGVQIDRPLSINFISRNDCPIYKPEPRRPYLSNSTHSDYSIKRSESCEPKLSSSSRLGESSSRTFHSFNVESMIKTSNLEPDRDHRHLHERSDPTPSRSRTVIMDDQTQRRLKLNRRQTMDNHHTNMDFGIPRKPMDSFIHQNQTNNINQIKTGSQSSIEKDQRRRDMKVDLSDDYLPLSNHSVNGFHPNRMINHLHRYSLTDDHRRIT